MQLTEVFALPRSASIARDLPSAAAARESAGCRAGGNVVHPWGFPFSISFRWAIALGPTYRPLVFHRIQGSVRCVQQGSDCLGVFRMTGNSHTHRECWLFG